MNWNQAKKSMKRGLLVESIVSRTIYEIKDGQLLAEGLPVKEGYVTEEEKQAGFEVANLVYADSLDDEMSEFLDKSYDHALFMMKYEDIKSANMIYK